MVLYWTLGDVLKTAYCVFYITPDQFIMGGIMQLTVDCVLMAQMAWYYGRPIEEKLPLLCKRNEK